MSSKILTLARLKKFLKERQGQTIVFTNGCFDILHIGHIRYLSAAKGHGDILVVGLNSDASVKKLKGPRRPVTPERERAEVLAALECVDCIVIFDQPTPERLISALQPDVLVKGGDWPLDKIVGADIVRAKKGKVLTVPFVKNKSTSRLIQKILRLG
jgi:rfaE bifunctional protein nucleotidyltransferase chain/domain